MEDTAAAFHARQVEQGVAVIEINGDVTPASEHALMHAYGEATSAGATAIVLDFSGLAYMNSGGIGLLVTLLCRPPQAAAAGVQHYRQILSLTRLDEAIEIHASEAEALAAA